MNQSESQTDASKEHVDFQCPPKNRCPSCPRCRPQTTNPVGRLYPVYPRSIAFLEGGGGWKRSRTHPRRGRPRAARRERQKETRIVVAVLMAFLLWKGVKERGIKEVLNEVVGQRVSCHQSSLSRTKCNSLEPPQRPDTFLHCPSNLLALFQGPGSSNRV